jgi:hypothetical protein
MVTFESRGTWQHIPIELFGYTIGLVNFCWPARVPNSSKADDIVIYIQGAVAPCVIRKATEIGYHFIGATYVEGRMNPTTAEQEKLETISIV